MKIHEYQGKALLKDYGVPVPRNVVARTPEGGPAVWPGPFQVSAA